MTKIEGELLKLPRITSSYKTGEPSFQKKIFHKDFINVLLTLGQPFNDDSTAIIKRILSLSLHNTQPKKGYCMNYQRLLFIPLLLTLVFSLSTGVSFAFPNEISSEERIEKLNDIELKIDDIATRKKELQKQSNDKSLSEEDRAELTQRLQTLTNQSREFNTLFEQTVLGGIDLSLFNEPEHVDPTENLNYNWQQEVLQILQPFFAQMQRMTEKTREKDLLIENDRELTKKIQIAESGIQILQGIDRTALNANSLKLISKVEDEWIDRLKSLEHQKNIVDLKLQDMTDSRGFFVRFTDNLWGFMKNEGLAIAVAIILSVGFYYIASRLILVFARYQQRDKTRVINFKWRLLLLILQAINIVFSLAIFLVILHTSGNIMLFGIVGLILLMLAISFRTKIPDYLHRLRVFLNLGQAREGERIIYNDIPWEIAKINLNNVYLTNPLLDNGELRVTIDLLDKLYSRHTLTDELWFPSRKGDFLLLPDKRIVKVIRQTPESIYLDHDGSTIVMGTAEFYKLKFSNLSRGYSLTLNFSLEELPENRTPVETIKQAITAVLQQKMAETEESLPTSIKEVSLAIRQLLSSSTTSYQIIIEMSANSAKYYKHAKAALNDAIIETACTKEWRLLLTENV